MAGHPAADYFPTALLFSTDAQPSVWPQESQQKTLTSLGHDSAEYLALKPDAHLVLGLLRCRINAAPRNINQALSVERRGDHQMNFTLTGTGGQLKSKRLAKKTNFNGRSG